MSRAKELRNEAGELNARAQALVKEFDGKDIPQEKLTEIETLFDQVEAKLAEARTLERAGETDEKLRAVPPGARLGGNPGSMGEGDEKGSKAEGETAAYRKALRLGVKALGDQERKALRADDDDAGGYLVMPQREATGLLKFVDDLVIVRSLATVEQLTDAASLGVVTLDSDIEDWDWTSELGTGSESTVNPFGKRALTPHPLAKRIKISNTLIRKSTRNVEQLVNERIGYKLGVTLEKGYMTGDGAQKPLGLFTASDQGISTARDVTYTVTNDKTKADSLIDMKYSLKAQYQASPTTRWIMHRDFAKAVRKLRDGSDQFLWAPGIIAGQPDQLLNTAVVQSEFAPNTISSGNYLAILGDIRAGYWIVDSLAIQIQTLLELYAESNQRGYIARYEGDGQPVLAEAFARLKHA